MTDNKENQTDFAAKIAQAKVRSIFSGALVLKGFHSYNHICVVHDWIYLGDRSLCSCKSVTPRWFEGEI